MKDLWNGRRVVVTGGAGFLGSQLVHRLASAGAHVTVVERPDADSWRLDGLENGIAFVRRDLALPPEAAAAFPQSDWAMPAAR